ncbi:MAG: pyridoxal-dependent decarboxylase [Candidatus Kapaibacteriales bacterium]
MKKYWIKKSKEEIKEKIFSSLKSNINFKTSKIMGVPASYLDGNVFYDDFPFLSEAPFLSTLISNPNHIGCHTLGSSEEFFQGTQAIERETIELLSVDLFDAEVDSTDGYIASGGTEANIQACWIYRNMLLKQGFDHNKITILCSEDTHYSIPKAANLLNLNLLQLPVNPENRQIDLKRSKELINERIDYIDACIIVLNMGTTMFGSVDDTSLIDLVKETSLPFKAHVDGAYGGFIYSVATDNNDLSFGNKDISSITIDAHKMLQAPYGTGIFLSRKGLIDHALTEEAGYVKGLDITLSGSRSGANAVAVWMILMTYGYYGWKELVNTLNWRTDYLCFSLKKKNINFFRHPSLNIVTLDSRDVDGLICEKYGLVPETHNKNNKYWKIVVMQHVGMQIINEFLDELENNIG